MFYAPADAVAFTKSGDLPMTMVSVAEFLFEKGILGEGAPSPDFVGVAYPDGSVTGDPNNVTFRLAAPGVDLPAEF
jgi:NitT/TauT family transport system substrate-binding protein